MSALDKIVRLHAQGKHDQSAHGKGRGGASSSDADIADKNPPRHLNKPMTNKGVTQEDQALGNSLARKHGAQIDSSFEAGVWKIPYKANNSTSKPSKTMIGSVLISSPAADTKKWKAGVSYVPRTGGARTHSRSFNSAEKAFAYGKRLTVDGIPD